ncbi:ATP-binding protein [Sphingomonas immobilis]|uniref:histidine kinase n=1 Tax=Sphingomonas immobilis TaxID=3063997 RepID=A0ABT8ZVN1_9SPHN|nr:ATP-binding protein [Sphingomonas sp. CA1-15]MDO7841204.1 ATP-binding protein [Sphingomonas sp. CA1-15]
MSMFRPFTVIAPLLAILMLVAAPMVRAAGAPDAFDAKIAEAKAAMVANPMATIEKARAAEAIAATLPPARRVTALATARWLSGEAYSRLGDMRNAAPLIEGAYKSIAQDPKPTKLKGDLLLSLGGVHMAKADVARALSDFQQAHDTFRDTGETRSRAIALLSIALLYQEANDYPKTLRYADQAREVYSADPQLLMPILNIRGCALKEMHRYAEAEKQFREAIMLGRKMHSPMLEARLLSNLARTQLLAGHLDAADRTIAEGLQYGKDKAAAAGVAQFWPLAAQAALQHHDARRAAELITRAFADRDPANPTLADREAHETAYLAFKAIGDDKQAMAHLEAQKHLDDEASRATASSNSALASARFDFANQELRITKLRNDELTRTAAFERARADTQRLIFIGAAVVTVVIVGLLGVGLFTIRRSRNEVRAANIDLAATNVALAKALAAKTEFLATTSHEIRTPLNGILGMTQVILADQNLAPTLRDRLGVVHGAGVTMRALVDDILDVAKMETGNMTIEQAPFDLKATLRDVCRLWQEQAKAKGLGFALDLDAAPDRIVGDAARLRQIVFNLLSNALKFTEKGEVRLSVRAVDDVLTIAISDSGIGIPADKYDLIFESFRQVDAGTTRRFGGTGLGLSICRNLARAMDGDVRVESVLDAGSTFFVDLPLVLAEPAVEETADAAPSVLLIVDRNPIARAMLRAVLEPRAGTIVFAASIEEAVTRIGDGGVAQILVDQGCVPAEDIDAALSGLARAAAGATTTLLWAAPDDGMRASAMKAGIDRIVAKPIAGAALAALMYDTELQQTVANGLVTRAA